MKSLVSRICVAILMLNFLVISAYCDNSEALHIYLNTEINNASANYVKSAIEKADTEGIKNLIIEIDTYGGRLDSADDIRSAIMNCDLNTTAYVNYRAESAGAVIALACDKIVMAPRGTIGSCEPVPKTEKSLSYVRSILTDIAKVRGRNLDILLAMADSDHKIDDLKSSGQLLNLSAKEAEDCGIADGIADNIEALKRDFKVSEISEFNMSLTDSILNFIGRSDILKILLTVGVVGMVVEILMPGFGIGGIMSILGYGLFFTGSIFGMGSGMGSLALFVIGLILIMIEIMIPGFGLPGIAGIICIVIGVSMAMNSLLGALGALSLAVLISAVIVFLAVKFGKNTKLARNLRLLSSHKTERGFVSSPDLSELIGRVGVTETLLRPSGHLLIDDRIYDAYALNGEFIEKGAQVEVKEVRGSKLFVRRIG